MMSTLPPPVLPDSAPFTPEQRGWLNGFLAAMLQGGAFPAAGLSAGPAALPPESPPTVTLPPISILWGSQTGTAEGLARKAAKRLTTAGAAVTVHDLATYPVAQLPAESVLLVITSTYGDGEPPDNAADFHTFLHSEAAPKFSSTHFAVLALGDSEYPDFCACGMQFDTRLEELGATRLTPRIDADVDVDDPYKRWESALLDALPALSPA